MEDSKKISFFGIFVWSLAILFFFYDFFLSIFLGTIADEVRESLDLTIRQFSIVAAAYYVTYGSMQIPVGILTEKIGTRIILSGAALICTIGVFLFSLATSFYTALAARLLIGFGSSFAFVSLLILALNWFPKKYFGFLCGLALFIGAAGPMVAGAPLAYVTQLLDGNWRLILNYIGGFGALLTLLLVIFMRNKPKLEREEIIFITPHEPLRRKLLELMKNRQAWYTVLCSSFLYCTLPIVAAYFGTSFLRARGFEKTDSAFIVSMVWVGYAIGNPLIGRFSDSLKRRTPFLSFFSFLGAFASIYLLYFCPDNYLLLLAIFFTMGLASSSQGLAFALIVEHTPQKLNSAALGFNNAGGMLFAALFPSIAGAIIEAAHIASPGEPLSSADYVAGLSLIPLLYALAGLLSLFCIKETFCRQQHEIHKLHPLHKASDLL
ncbi:MAG: MFS transporter [Chlamydiales bacterium]|nr:MFS transporter [Chlamydiales bacterium]